MRELDERMRPSSWRKRSMEPTERALDDAVVRQVRRAPDAAGLGNGVDIDIKVWTMHLHFMWAALPEASSTKAKPPGA